ncbi:MAG TPA: glycosyltransferase family 1 protein [Actinomycetota bacterium]|nr:glycosyltransferase family 1 protein [Actinomycetota bacterium]
MSEPLRVAMTLEQCWHRVPGGTAVAALGMARGLTATSGTTVIGVAARHRHLPEPEWRPPVPVAHLGLPRIALYESWHRWRRPAVEGATGPVDLIHATSLAVPPRSAPLAVTIHDLAFVRDPTHFTRHGLSFFKRGLACALADADMILCPSRATADDCLEAGFAGGRVHVVPLGVDQTAIDPGEAEASVRRLGIDGRFVVWAGTIEPRKNLPRLLRAWRRVDTDAELVLVGPTGWNEDLAELVSGTPRVRSLGWVGRRDLTALYARADLLCWPSLWEGFGFPVLEAMVQSTAVITSAGTSTEELAGDAGRLVDPRDETAMAEALQDLLDDASLRDRLAQRGRERARAYTWEATAERLLDAYELGIGAVR